MTGPRTHIADYVTAPAEISVTAHGYRGYDVDLTLKARRGGFDCESLVVRRRGDGPPVTGEALRSIAVADLVREVLMRSTHMLWVEAPDPDDGIVGGGSATWFTPGTEFPEDLRALWPGKTKTVHDRNQRDVALRNCAARYLVADALGVPPKQDVAVAFGVSVPTASRIIAAARERGFIPPKTTGAEHDSAT